MLMISLKAARVNCGMTQKEAAQAIKVDAATIINWEKGKTAPRVTQLQMLSKLYEIPMDCIFLDRNSTLREPCEA